MKGSSFNYVDYVEKDSFEIKKLLADLLLGTFDGSKVIPEELDIEEIMYISDFEVLEKLCESFSVFQRLEFSEPWRKTKDTRLKIRKLNSYLKDLCAYTCYCTKYTHVSFLQTFWETEEGRVELLEGSDVCDSCLCKCIQCKRMFKVNYSLDFMGYDNYEWQVA